MSADEFVRVERGLRDARRPRQTHPKGWEPGIDTEKGLLTHLSDAAAAPSDWSDILQELGLDPTRWTVDESAGVQVRTWDSGDRRMYYYRATVRPLSSSESEDVDALVGRVLRERKGAQKRTESVERTLVVCLADWQAGKGTHDRSGTEQLVQRLVTLRDAVPARIRQLNKAGTPVNHLAVIGLGDLVEACDGHYAMQTYETELDMREQSRLVRRILIELLSVWVKHTPELTVGCVPGNHGQRRKNGKVFTSWGDNVDVESFEVVREVLQANPDVFGHIRWAIPDQEQTITLDLSGTVVGFAHGHQFGTGTGPQGKALRWWANMAMAREAVGDSDVLVSGHYHHLQVHAEGAADNPRGRTWLQCPALDCGSPWWEHQGGAPTQQGTLTFTTDGNGWDNLQVLR
jgi:predicted phosphodiesterase